MRRHPAAAGSPPVMHKSHHLWARHPGVRGGSQLTLGERAADRMRLAMGSWPFVFGALAFLAGWMATRGLGADGPPFILLNLLLSCLAALQGAILLIAAKRADQVAAELAQHDFEVDSRAADQIAQIHQHLNVLFDRLGFEQPDPEATGDVPGPPELPPFA